MNQSYLRANIPNFEVLIDLQPEEFGAIIIRAIAQGREQRVHASGVMSAFYPTNQPGEVEGFPTTQRSNVERAMFEAWSWLEAQGLLVWSDFANGVNGYRSLSRRAERFTIEEFRDFAAARALPRDIIHAGIRDRVWQDFIRGNYDAAVLYAARQVEIAVRQAGNFGNEKFGVSLMREAFNPDRGVLVDNNALGAEKEARMHLFAGFIGSYKNPLSHRDVDMSDPYEAIEVLLLASHLLRIVDARSEALAAG